MNNKTDKTTGVELIEKQIAVLENRKRVLEKLIQEKEAIENRMEKLITGKEDVEKEPTYTPRKKRNMRKPRQLVFPRGVLTAATFSVLEGNNNKPMPSEQIVEAVKSSPLLRGNVPNDIDRRVRGLLVASHQFKSVGNDLYTTSKPKLTGKLFERISAIKQQEHQAA